jgi:hypothetical protein
MTKKKKRVDIKQKKKEELLQSKRAGISSNPLYLLTH